MLGAQGPGLPVIGAQEECVQARRRDGEGVDPGGVQAADDRIEVLGVRGESDLDLAFEPLAGIFRDPGSIGEARRRAERDHADRGAGVPSQLGQGPGRHRPAPADDAHPVGQSLDLAEDVARQQDGAALLTALADDLLECLFPSVGPARSWVRRE